ncbi:restriction system protein [Xanthomonas arboricola]|uniref:restriction endonuclease n=1 Tax=Xanthomonas campestris TaxID=339 RepID=UPI0023E93484|nr:restriction system protein [Xanthomonas campestris]MCW2006547.1 restriction system protein [Xanthomonas campestris]
MKKIFISSDHARGEGSELASYIQSALAPLGFEVLGRQNNLPWNNEAESSVTTLINKCDVFLCYSDADSSNIMFELGYALGANKKIILVGDAKTIPFDLRNTLYIRRGASPFEIIDHLERHAELYAPPEFEIGAMGSDPVGAISSLVSRPDWLSSVEPREFEALIANWFFAKGFHVKQNVGEADSGYDFTINPFMGGSALVEVKKYKQTSHVPVSTIRQMVGSMAIVNAGYGVIVSSAPFTQAAIYFASEIGKNISLLTLEDLNNMRQLDRHGVEQAAKR